MSDSDSLTARLKRELLLMKAKAEALEFSVSEKDAEIELLHDRQERQHAQVQSELSLHTVSLATWPDYKPKYKPKQLLACKHAALAHCKLYLSAHHQKSVHVEALGLIILL